MKLELVSIDRQKPSIVLEQLPVIVGLDRGADVCLDDSSIGHYQCMIDDSDGVLMVWDLGTKAGTFINGNRIVKKCPLLPGDEIAMGKSRFVAKYDNGAKPSKLAHDAAGGPHGSAPAHRRRQPAAHV
jgi:pSer/pThr/pTyr-binding forkhead associated (FHA) protein